MLYYVGPARCTSVNAYVEYADAKQRSDEAIAAINSNTETVEGLSEKAEALTDKIAVMLPVIDRAVNPFENALKIELSPQAKADLCKAAFDIAASMSDELDKKGKATIAAMVEAGKGVAIGMAKVGEKVANSIAQNSNMVITALGDYVRKLQQSITSHVDKETERISRHEKRVVMPWWTFLVIIGIIIGLTVLNVLIYHENATTWYFSPLTQLYGAFSHRILTLCVVDIRLDPRPHIPHSGHKIPLIEVMTSTK